MPQIGTLSLNLYTVDRDETVYAAAGHSVSNKNLVAIRRTQATKNSPNLRTQIRHEKTIPNAKADDVTPRSVTVSIAVTVPPGLNEGEVRSFVETAVAQSAASMSELALTGDIHL